MFCFGIATSHPDLTDWPEELILDPLQLLAAVNSHQKEGEQVKSAYASLHPCVDGFVKLMLYFPLLLDIHLRMAWSSTLHLWKEPSHSLRSLQSLCICAPWDREGALTPGLSTRASESRGFCLDY